MYFPGGTLDPLSVIKVCDYTVPVHKSANKFVIIDPFLTQSQLQSSHNLFVLPVKDIVGPRFPSQ